MPALNSGTVPTTVYWALNSGTVPTTLYWALQEWKIKKRSMSQFIANSNTENSLQWYTCWWARYLSRCSNWLRAGRSGNRIPVGTRFSAPVQTGHGAYPSSSTMGTGSFPGVKNGRSVTLTPHPFLVPWSWKGRATPIPPPGPYRTSVPVQGVHFTLYYKITK